MNQDVQEERDLYEWLKRSESPFSAGDDHVWLWQHDTSYRCSDRIDPDRCLVSALALIVKTASYHSQLCDAIW